ncbi:hypothetical protein ACWDTI_05525 [Gordonia sp. NPDC003424]
MAERSDGFGSALRAEFARMRRNPGDTVAIVTVNGVMMTIVWFTLPRSWFFTFTGPSGYALALATWMYADVTATNILAADRDRVLELFDDPESLRTVLRAKQTALWLIIAPICAAVAIACGFVEDDWPYTGLVVLAVVVIPVGALAVTGLVGVLFPYHQRPLRWRWQERHRFRPVIVRWTVLSVTPFLVYPASALLIMAVPLGIWWLVNDFDGGHRIPTSGFALCLLAASVISFVCWWFAHRFALRWVRGHEDDLRTYLGDPERG